MKSINYFTELKKVYDQINHGKIEDFCKIINKKIVQKKTIFTCGNGGSAQSASHMVTDLNLLHPKKIKSVCLSDNKGLVTAIGNDFGYDKIFSHQLKKLATKGDILICLSCSGNSKNIINVIKTAKKIGVKTLSIVGFKGGKAKLYSDNCLHINSNDMQICEDVHMSICHYIAKKICKIIIKK